LVNPVPEDSSDDESSSEEDSEEEEEPPKSPTPPPKTPTPPPPPPPEDPLDIEERMMNAQLALSFTLTLTDEENIRQRLLEIRKTKLKREKVSEVEVALTEKFEKEAEAIGEKSRAKEEEQKILLTRLVNRVSEGKVTTVLLINSNGNGFLNV
jgi:hypothetical protein